MAAPVGVAQALPGLYTGAMYTARVGDALVTVLALPAIQTPARHTEPCCQPQKWDIKTHTRTSQ